MHCGCHRFFAGRRFWNPAGCTTYFTSKCQSEYFGAEAVQLGLAVRGNTIHANQCTAHRMAQQSIVTGEAQSSPLTPQAGQTHGEWVIRAPFYGSVMIDRVVA